MTTQVEAQVQQIEQAQPLSAEERARISSAVGKLMLAAIGAVAISQESLQTLMNRLVDRGVEVQAGARNRATELTGMGRHLPVLGKQMVESALDTVTLASKTDIQSLHDQLAELSAKVDRLAAEKEQP